MTPQVHTFTSSGEAYDASQTHEEIKDGDVLSVPSERVVGVLIEAWPTAVGEEHGAFHTLSDEYEWEAIPVTSAYPAETPKKDYSASWWAAREELDRVCLDYAQATDDELARRLVRAEERDLTSDESAAALAAVAARIGLGPNDTEQGLTREASAKIDAFLTEHLDERDNKTRRPL